MNFSSPRIDDSCAFTHDQKRRAAKKKSSSISIVFHLGDLGNLGDLLKKTPKTNTAPTAPTIVAAPNGAILAIPRIYTIQVIRAIPTALEKKYPSSCQEGNNRLVSGNAAAPTTNSAPQKRITIHTSSIGILRIIHQIFCSCTVYHHTNR